MSFWCPYFDRHLITFHSNIGDVIVAMLELDTSILEVHYIVYGI